MTLFEKIFELAKKLSKAITEDKDLRDVDAANIFSDEAIKHIKQHLSEEEIKKNLELLNKIDKENGWKEIENRISQDGKVKN
ncbi:hypothetical protein [Gelidibacter algens]|uniref:hypothetical protein n=1 Tax=Gelidibacter algens TaxID=49280 RepID=UPI0012F8D562|nr:hypothetical protein [Gelidibacter algens]